jgi:hypothetical protein
MPANDGLGLDEKKSPLPTRYTTRCSAPKCDEGTPECMHRTLTVPPKKDWLLKYFCERTQTGEIRQVIVFIDFLLSRKIRGNAASFVQAKLTSVLESASYRIGQLSWLLLRIRAA